MFCTAMIAAVILLALLGSQAAHKAITTHFTEGGNEQLDHQNILALIAVFN